MAEWDFVDETPEEEAELMEIANILEGVEVEPCHITTDEDMMIFDEDNDQLLQLVEMVERNGSGMEKLPQAQVSIKSPETVEQTKPVDLGPSQRHERCQLEKMANLVADIPANKYLMEGRLFSEISLDGWSNQIPVAFHPKVGQRLNLQNAHHLTKKFDEEEGVDVEEFMTTIEELLCQRREMNFRPETFACDDPLDIIDVEILAKRIVHVTVSRDSKIQTIGCMAVGDLSTKSFCFVSCHAESVSTLYDQVQLGDRIMLQNIHCREMVGSNQLRTTLFHPSRYCPLEIIVTSHQTRAVFTQTQSFPQFPTKEIRNFYNLQLKSPADLRGYIEHPRTDKENLLGGSKFFDLFGVISYAGRIERRKSGRVAGNVLRAPQGLGHSDSVPYQRYCMRRWITLSDKDGSSVHVQLCVSSLNHREQEEIVPGQLVVLSHCLMKKKLKCLERWVCLTTSFTQLYFGIQLYRYPQLRPTQLGCLKHEDFLKDTLEWYRTAMKKVSHFYVGGTLPIKIVDGVRFHSRFIRGVNERNEMRIERELERREVEPMLTYYGKVVAVQKVLVNSTDGAGSVYQREAIPPFEQPAPDKEPLIQQNYLQRYITDSCYSWNWFRFQLVFNPGELREIWYPSGKKNLLEVVGAITSRAKKCCGCLLLPSQLPTENGVHQPPETGELENAEPGPFLVTLLLDCGSEGFHEMIWLNEQLPAEVKWGRARILLGKTVLVLGDRVKTCSDTPTLIRAHDLRPDLDLSDN